jgi:hypothetical protein
MVSAMLSLCFVPPGEGGLEGGIAKHPKAKNTEILLSPPRDGGENEEKNVTKLNDFFSKLQSSITLLRSRIIENGKNGLEIWAIPSF